QYEKDVSTYKLIRKEQHNKQIIYISVTTDGVTDGGSFRGSFRDNKIFTIKRYYDRVEFVNLNTNFYFDPQNAISKAADANISNAILISEKIEAEDKEKGEILIKADKVFLGEDFSTIKPNYPPSYQGFRLGMLSKDKTKYGSIRNYPKNTDVVVEYTFDNAMPQGGSSEAVTDRRFVTVKSQHSLIEMPKNDFIPTFDDPRVGYFTTEVTDLTGTKSTNYRDFVHKWHLKKKDPNAALSEPVEPIVFWIENTTPVAYRETIRKAGLAWNEAFEKAGFKNAVEIKIQPDTASWDAGDIRYNVLRWTSSPEPPFGGYGPSFVNPRTGQILGADIMLEYSYITGAMRNVTNFDMAALPLYEKEEEISQKNKHFCSLGKHLSVHNTFAHTAIELLDNNNKEQYIEETLYYLVLHEMGHTLGLNHNMKATQLHSPEDLHNAELTRKVGLQGSVMDYPLPNVAADKNKQGQYFTTKPGPYDLWAIEFAYASLANEAQEKARLEKVLARSTEPALAFGNDADDMRSSYGGIDPRVMIFDHSSDMISYGSERMKLADKLLEKLKNDYIQNNQNQSYNELLMRYYAISSQKFNSANAISRYVGGVYVDRGFIGQQGAKQPFTPIAAQEQKRAMKVLTEQIFAPDAFKVNDDLYNYLQKQRRGFNFFGNGEDPRINERVLNVQAAILSHLLNANTQQRILNTEHYGNTYKLAEMMNDLTAAVFKADLNTNVNTFRQNLQIEYVGRLLAIAGLDKPSLYVYPAQSVALYQLNQIKKMLKNAKGGDTATQAHREHIIYRIEKAQK
ncbi:MAG: zinc-dependent metalloprotease, partial [Thermonemataceae bacterium]|nr:zinc-dependent metalloprotease [Thermonemataceae bacterium]